MKNILYISRGLQKESELLNLFEEFEFFDIPPEGLPYAVSRKNDFIVPYDYGFGIIDKKQYVLRLSAACTANCEYCYIKAENKHAKPVFFYNISKIINELEKIKEKDNLIYVNAGENSDSLAFDRISKQSLILYYLAERFPDIKFELRTKLVDFTPEFFKRKPLKNLIIAVSINPDSVIREYENKSASLQKRIEVLKRLSSIGYNIAFRIDPIIYSDRFYEEYGELVNVIQENFEKNDIFDIQIGCLRMNKMLYKNLKNQHSKLLAGELFQGEDGKYHYYIGIRIMIYKYLISRLSSFKCPVTLSNENGKCIKLSI